MTHNPQEQEHLHCTDVAKFLQLMHQVGDVFEVRCIDCPDRRGGQYRSTVSGYFDDLGKAVQAISEIESREPIAVYFTLNPVNRDLLARCANRVQSKAKNTSTDADVVSRRWLFVDIDPKRPAGISATDGEVAHATAISDAIQSELRSLGWPEPVQGMSGNGRYLMYRIDLPNDDASRDLVREVLHGLAYRHNTDHAEVDCSTFNAARVCKVLGTHARKGDSLSERPHRKSWFINQDKPIDVVSAELLLTVAAWVPAKDPVVSIAAHVGDNVLERASRYLGRMDPSIEGMKGHDKLLVATSAMVRGFDLNDADAFHLLASEFNQRCVPSWSEREIRHKINEARSKGDRPFGYLLTEGGNVVAGRNSASSCSSNGGVNADSDLSPDDQWPEPLSIDRPILPAFPVNTLPEPLRAWVVATSEACQVPSDLPALLALACCGGAAARRVEMLAGRGWIEPINLYVACLLEPANRKSAVFSAALRPLREIERELMKMAAPEVARLSSARRVKESKMKKAERKACDKSCDESAQLAGVLAAELSEEPIASMPKLLVDDATAEAVEMQLAAQDGRLICAGAEGGLFDVMAGRYSSGVGNLDCFLKGHAGDDLRVDRVIRGSIVVDRCCLTLAYAIQPEVIRGMADRPSFRGRGLIGRFLYSMPETRLGKRSINSAPVSSHVAVGYSTLVRRLASIQASGDEPRLLAMAPDATSCFHAWQIEVEGWLGDSGRLREMRDWGGKLCGLTARLAAILHLVETNSGEPWNVPIGLSVIESAIGIARWSVFHAEAVIGLMTGAGGGLDDAGYVLRWIRESERTEFSRRDVHVHARSRFDGEREKLDDALELLVDRGWIRHLSPIERSGPGQKPSPRFEVNPVIAMRRSAPKAPTADNVIEPPARVRGVM